MQQATDQTSINTHEVAYSATWATGAQNFAAKPSTATEIPQEANGAHIIFGVADAADENVTATLWGWKSNGPASDLVLMNPVQAGSTVLGADWANPSATLTNFFCADTVTITTNNSYARVDSAELSGTTNGIAVLRLDLTGYQWLFMSYDIDLAANSGTDAIAWITYF